MQHCTRMTPFSLVFLGLLMTYGCDKPHVSAAKQVCACFDIAGYKIEKGHKEGAQGFGRCKTLMDKALSEFKTQPAAHAAFLAELAKCPAASTQPTSLGQP
ncbi:MAG: hypothetical protein VX589_07680 [Myxococcota bacterium]|nr:hypothetical protein [Myxococcota bacterium]